MGASALSLVFSRSLCVCNGCVCSVTAGLLRTHSLGINNSPGVHDCGGALCFVLCQKAEIPEVLEFRFFLSYYPPTMIHCMVKRRMAPAAAGGHIKLSLESSSSSATGRTQEFATTTTHAAAAGTNHYSSTDRRRRNSYMVNSEPAPASSSSSRAAGGSGTSEQQGGNLHESPKRDGSRVAEEEEEVPSSIGPAQRLCVGGGKKRLSPYRRVSDVREARRASLDNNSSHKFAYVSSLEGRLMINSAQLATESGGGGLPPEKETQQAAASKTKEMDPLERVLIVAVSAAAAAAGKYQKMEEFSRLRNAVDARVSKIRFP